MFQFCYNGKRLRVSVHLSPKNKALSQYIYVLSVPPFSEWIYILQYNGLMVKRHKRPCIGVIFCLIIFQRCICHLSVIVISKLYELFECKCIYTNVIFRYKTHFITFHQIIFYTKSAISHCVALYFVYSLLFLRSQLHSCTMFSIIAGIILIIGL